MALFTGQSVTDALNWDDRTADTVAEWYEEKLEAERRSSKQ